LLITLKSYNIFKRELSGNYSKLPDIAIILAGYLLLFTIQFRFNGRPEMTSHLLTAAFLYFLINYRFNPGRSIYWLILLQVVWANFHEAFGTGLVMMLAVTGATWVEYFALRGQKGFENLVKPKHLTYATALSILAVAVNPQGLKLILHPLNIFGQVQANKFTTELISFQSPGYWQTEAYISAALFVTCIFLLFINFRKEDVKWYLRPVANVGAGYILMLFLFFYLNLTAYRNIVFFIILCIPLISVGFRTAFNNTGKLIFKLKINPAIIKTSLYILLIAGGVTAYGYVGTGKFFKKFSPRENYGLKINPDFHPIGAADFIKENNIRGNCFSDFLISSYLLWKLTPDFKTYIDLRDLDIFTREFYQEFAKITYDPELFNLKDEQYNFNYVALYRPNMRSFHVYLNASPDWELVFAGPVAAIFLKNNEQNKKLIEQYGIADQARDVFEIPNSPIPTSLASSVSKLFWPPYDPSFLAPLDYDLIAASYYLLGANYDLAIEHATQSTNNDIENWLGHDMLGNIYLDIAKADTIDSSRLQLLVLSERSFSIAIEMNPKAAMSHLGKGLVYMHRGQWPKAMINLKKSIQFDDKNLYCYMYMAECQNNMIAIDPGNERRYLRNWLEYIKKANKLNPDNPLLKLNLGIGYCRLGDCEQAVKILKDLVYLPGLPLNDVNFAKNCLQECGGR
ncbi:MAG: hypothetical protein IIA45_12745, partial [Bacteroidetes bacterium]|nr:hypothetical protein [Bacteroidota bacterium]